jgi:hypothetical protein
MKTYKTFHSFRGAVCKGIAKNKHDKVLPTLVRMGYAIKEVIELPYAVTYGFADDVSATQEDVEKVVNEINSRRI